MMVVTIPVRLVVVTIVLVCGSNSILIIITLFKLEIYVPPPVNSAGSERTTLIGIKEEVGISVYCMC
jgi:hypothetical protein